MTEQQKISSDLWKLEQALVNQFRLLQKFVNISQQERSALLNNSVEIMRITEEKEALLDELGMVDDERRQVVNDLALAFKIPGDFCSVKDLLPYLSLEDASRISRLAEGIYTLVGQSKEINEANQMLAHVKIDILKATQSFLINLAQPEVDYRPLGAKPVMREAAGTGFEIRA